MGIKIETLCVLQTFVKRFVRLFVLLLLLLLLS